MPALLLMGPHVEQQGCGYEYISRKGLLRKGKGDDRREKGWVKASTWAFVHSYR